MQVDDREVFEKIAPNMGEMTNFQVFMAGVEYARTQDSKQPVGLTDEQILTCVRSVGTPVPRGLTRDSGPHEVTEPTWFLAQLVRAIEREHGIPAPQAAQEKTR